jgi:hypothetical protein
MVPVPIDAESPDEKPLTRETFDEFCKPFSRVETYPLRLLGRLDRVFPQFDRELATLDRTILDSVTALHPLAGLVVFKVYK